MKRRLIHGSELSIRREELRLLDLALVGILDASVAVARSPTGSENPALVGDVFVVVRARRSGFEEIAERARGFEKFQQRALPEIPASLAP